MKAVLITALALACLVSLEADDDERFFVDAKLNGKPVRFMFDTGAGIPFAIYSTTAQRLGLKVREAPADAPSPPPGQIAIGWTDSQKLDLLDFGCTNMDTCFGVVRTPSYLKTPEDGVLGWPALSSNIFYLDCISQTMSIFTNAAANFNGWVKCSLRSNSDLTLGLPGDKSKQEIIALDTGCAYGVKLNPQNWRNWRAAHTNLMTLQAYYTPNPGLVVAEEGWANEISLGSLRLTGVAVMPADSADIAVHSSPQTQFEATLGFAAMKRLDIVVDGIHGVVYVRPRSTPPLPYRHNRLGAVFVPQDLQKGEDLVAQAMNGSPAFEAGIRNGDVLTRIGNLDCTRWRTDPNVLPLSRFFNDSAGTKLELTLERGGKTIQATVTLRNILPPD